MVEPPTGVQTNFSRDLLKCAFMRDLYDYWRSASGSEGMPPLSAIDPIRLPRSCLPHLSILEVEQSPFRLRSRLNGTGLVEQLGTDFTGRYLDEVPGLAQQIARMEWCVREKRPYVAESALTFGPNNHKHYQVLILPFGGPGSGVQRVMGAFCFPDDKKSTPSWVL